MRGFVIYDEIFPKYCLLVYEKPSCDRRGLVIWKNLPCERRLYLFEGKKKGKRGKMEETVDL